MIEDVVVHVQLHGGASYVTTTTRAKKKKVVVFFPLYPCYLFIYLVSSCSSSLHIFGNLGGYYERRKILSQLAHHIHFFFPLLLLRKRYRKYGFI